MNNAQKETFYKLLNPQQKPSKSLINFMLQFRLRLDQDDSMIIFIYNGMKRQIKKEDIVQYILSDFQFLQDYEVIDSYKSNKDSFVACIRNSEQKVRFVKRKFSQQQLQRFKILHKLYKHGIVLCDNLFILQQRDELQFYVIEAEIQTKNPRFQTLQNYLYHSQLGQQERKNLLSKIKILVDCLHQQGQYYAGLNTRKIIIDDEKHVYLAPYDLQFQLKTDHFSRAYYSPELLLKISRVQTQISEQLMQKWDFWAFGCMALQVMGYSCPFFMSTSLPKQLRMIQSFQLQAHLSSQQQTVTNLLTNSLCINQQRRSLSAAKNSSKDKQNNSMINEFKQAIQDIRQQNPQKSKKGIILRQLNIYPSQPSQSKTDCQLTFNILTLNNISFLKELQMQVHLNRIYHIYLDFNENNPKKYQINKKITIKATFHDFQTLLQNPVKIQLREQNKLASIFLNLNSLILKRQNQRIWRQPIIGTYSSAKTGDFSRARLKISCALLSYQNDQTQKVISPNQDIKQNNVLLNKTLKIKNNMNIGSVEKNIKPSNGKKVEQPNPPSIKETVPKVILNKQQSLSNLDKIPSISQIAQHISLITQNFKRKLNAEQSTKQNSLQKKITSLLKIETLGQ